MYPKVRLIWEDEVRLSDAIFPAREVRLRLGGSEATTQLDQDVLAKAQVAMDELVLSHSTLAQRAADEVLFGSPSSATIDREDLVQVGMIAMYSCAKAFDARRRSDGIDRDTGNRFSFYAKMYIKRAMYRTLKGGDALMTGSVATRDRTREWLNHRDALAEELGRKPTLVEVSEYCGIAIDTIDMTLLGRRAVISAPSGTSDDGEEMEVDAGEPERTGDVDDQILAEAYALALDRVLRSVLMPDEVDAFSLWMGIDRAVPRSVPEVARELGFKVAPTMELVGRAVARLRHPQNLTLIREAARDALDAIEGAHQEFAALEMARR